MKTQVIDKHLLKNALLELVQSEQAFMYQLFWIIITQMEAQKMEKLDTLHRRKALAERYRQLPRIEEKTFTRLQEAFADVPPTTEWRF